MLCLAFLLAPYEPQEPARPLQVELQPRLHLPDTQKPRWAEVKQIACFRQKMPTKRDKSGLLT